MKRLFDFSAALVGLIVLAPLLLVIAVAIKLAGPGPAVYAQERMGLKFKPFMLYKFRTMRPDADRDGPSVTSEGDKRITGIGRLLRKFKLDELLQLYNVLKGDMSLVGPRPEVRKYVEMFPDDFKVILSVRPGITDYAAIEYRNEEGILSNHKDPEECYVNEVLPAKIRLYKRYISDNNMLLDVALILRTIAAILVARDR